MSKNFSRKAAREIFFSIPGHDEEADWDNNWRTWFTKRSGLFKVKDFYDGSNIWTLVPQHIKDKYMLDCCNKAVPAGPCADPMMIKMGEIMFGSIVGNQKETETTMYADNRTEAQQAKDYLIESARAVAREKDKQARKDFNIDYRGPSTLGELKEAVKNGWFTITPEAEKLPDEFHLWSITDALEVRDPEKKTDGEGYKKATQEIAKDHSDVKDAIIVLGAEKGLEKLNEWKEKTYH